MSSPDVAESQEELIKNLKEAVAAEVHHAANGDAEVTANGNGVHHDGDGSNGVDYPDDGSHSRPHQGEAPEAAPSTPKPEDSPSAADPDEAPSAADPEEAPSAADPEEAPSAPKHEEAASAPEHEEAPPTPKHDDSHAPPQHEEPLVQEDEHSPEPEEEKEAAVVVPHVAVCPASPQHDDDAEESFAPAGHEEEVPPVPVTRMRDEWMAKRQSSLDMRREVEAQSRPVLSKAAMSTSVDEQSVREAYEAVRSDTSDTEWAVFNFQGQKIVCADTGVGFDEFRGHFADGDRAFGFIRIQMGDEMSKRQKFVFLTWVGPEVSVIRRAKMSIDKAMVKNIVKNFAVELQVETQAEINVEYFREQLARAGGANYGTGFRD